MPCEYVVLSQSVQSLSRVWLFVTPWITAHQASQSITNFQSSLKLMSIEFPGFSYFGVGYLFTAAPAKCSRCSLSWMKDISSHCPSWPWMWSSSSRPSWARAAAAPWTWGCSSRALPLTSGKSISWIIPLKYQFSPYEYRWNYVSETLWKYLRKIFCIKDKINYMIYMCFVNISFLNFLSFLN